MNFQEDTLPAGEATTDQRALIAIVYADMAGYSRLIGLDDSGTVARLRELRRDLIDPAMARHGGDLVNTAGDSLLIRFTSILGAVRFAVDVQRGVPDFDGDFPPDRRVRFRMGVNVSDVIAEGANLHGDGVNIAARLQTICPLGGICISRIVRDHVGNRLGLGFKELGSIELKNIARPIEAFLLELEDRKATQVATVAAPARRSRPGVMRFAGAALGGLIALGSLGVAGWQLRPAPPPPATASDSGSEGPPPLSIAVLPFTNLSGDSEQAYLADGIAEDLTTDLSHLEGAFVIARESAFSFRGKTMDIREIGRQLGVRYLLEGSVRRINASVRINAQLIAADTGAHVWAEHYDKPFAELGEGQDDVVARIGSALNVRLVKLETARRGRGQGGSPAAFDLVLRARSVLQEKPTEDRNLIALGLLLQALRLGPRALPAMAETAALFAGALSEAHWTKRAADLVEEAERLAPGSPDLLVAKYLILQREQRSNEALALYRRILDTAPGATGSILPYGLCTCWTNTKEAIALLRRTIQINPRSTMLDGIRLTLARSLLINDGLAEATDLLEQNVRASDAAPPEDERDGGLRERWLNGTLINLTIAYERLGRDDDARRVLKRALTSRLLKDFTVRSYVRSISSYDDEGVAGHLQSFAADLRRAGLRDHLDEEADSLVASTANLQEFTKLDTLTPMDLPGGKTVTTKGLRELLEKPAPIILTTHNVSPTVPHATYVIFASTGTTDDVWQERLQRLMQELVKGDMQRPIVVFGGSIYQWQPRNLGLRLIALGYKNVYWYRGGWEAWEASGQIRSPIAARRRL